MKKLLAGTIIVLLIAALLCPFALMEEEIAPEAVDAPVGVSDAVELTDEAGSELLESQAVLLESENLAEGGTHTGAFKIIVEGGSQGGATPMVGGVRAESADANTTISLRYDGGTIGATVTFDGGSIDLPDGSYGTIVEFTMPAKDVTIQLRFSESQGDTGGTGGSGNTEIPADAIPLDEAHFPDPAFRQYLTEWYDKGGHGCISKAALDSTEHLILNTRQANASPQGYGITSLKGIEYFPNLKTLNCSYNPITSLDAGMLSGMKQLESLGCSNCSLTSLDVSGCEGLKWLSCDYNQLTSLDVSMRPGLLTLDCQNNALTSLNVTGLSNLSYLTANNNQLTSLDLTGCSNISLLFIDHNQISSVNVSGCKTIMKYWKQITREVKKKAGYVRWVYYWKKSDKSTSEIDIHVDSGTKIVTKGGSSSPSAPSAPTVPVSFANTSEGMTVTVDASSTAKNTKATVVAPAGSTTQLDLSGAKGKKFKSSNKKVATVNKNGVVTFKGSGKVKITYKVGKKTRKVTLTVTDPTFPTTIALNPSGVVAAKVGEPQTLTATLNDGAVSGIKWKSSNKKVATVSNGVVTFKKAGKVKITATTTRGKKKASVTFRVTK